MTALPILFRLLRAVASAKQHDAEVALLCNTLRMLLPFLPIATAQAVAAWPLIIASSKDECQVWPTAACASSVHAKPSMVTESPVGAGGDIECSSGDAAACDVRHVSAAGQLYGACCCCCCRRPAA